MREKGCRFFQKTIGKVLALNILMAVLLAWPFFIGLLISTNLPSAQGWLGLGIMGMILLLFILVNRLLLLRWRKKDPPGKERGSVVFGVAAACVVMLAIVAIFYMGGHLFLRAFPLRW